MDGFSNDLPRVSEWIETVLWRGAGLVAVSADQRRSSHKNGAASCRVARQIVGLVLAVTLAAPSLAGAQGWWRGGPSNPGFDQNTVIQVTGQATQVDLDPRGGPATLRLQTGQETFTVMLAPGWYLSDVHPDLRIGDPITVEGSKIMDRWGDLHLVAARVMNRRTGSVLELRDEMGRPLWMGGHPWGKGR